MSEGAWGELSEKEHWFVLDVAERTTENEYRDVEGPRDVMREVKQQMGCDGTHCDM